MLIIATYLSHNNDFFTSETRIFCFHCKRKVCESHEVTISFSCTLTYTFAIISAQGPPWMRTQASFSIILRCDFLYTSCLCCDGDEPRRFFAGTISTHSNSTRISQSEFQKVYAPLVLGVRPSAHLPPTTRGSRVSRAFTMAISAVLAFLHASKLCQLSGGPDRGALGTRISRWRGRR